MLEQRREAFSIQFFQILDAVCVFLSFWVGILVWNHYGSSMMAGLGVNTATVQFGGKDSNTPILYAICPLIPLLLETLGFYKRPGKQLLSKALGRTILAHLLIFSGIALVALLFRFDPHRPTLILGLGISSLLIWLRELSFKFYVNNCRSDLTKKAWILLAGHPEKIKAWWGNLPEGAAERYHVVGHYDLSVGNAPPITNVLEESSAERVVFLAEGCPFKRLALSMEECELMGVEVWLAADFVRARICQPSFDILAGTPMLVLRSTPTLSWSLIIKEIMDRVLSAIVIFITLPVWIAIAIGIKLSDRGPVFFKQERAGRYGKPFMMWKFRTMVVDAEAKLQALKDEMGNQMSGPVFKLDHDPRIFPLGRFLRKYSLDELPQFLNVLLGDMSLVGPRPMAVYELPHIEKSEHRRKLSVKPGITCIWQVEGRNTITNFDEWVQLDLKYIDNWSLWLDIKLLVKTVPAVLFARGAK